MYVTFVPDLRTVHTNYQLSYAFTLLPFRDNRFPPVLRWLNKKQLAGDG